MSMYAASSMICALPDEPLQRPFHVLMPHFLALLNDLIRAGDGALCQQISNDAHFDKRLGQKTEFKSHLHSPADDTGSETEFKSHTH